MFFLFIFLLVHGLAWDLNEALQTILDDKASFYNCTMAFGFHNNTHSFQMVSGKVSRDDSSRDLIASDRFVWGSVTKVATGSSVLRLAEQSKISLTDSIVPYIDPFLKSTMPKLGSLENLFGPKVSKVTVRDLLAMRSGVPDFDTAKPWPTPVDPFRATVYANPDIEYTPEVLLSQPWVKTGKLDFDPGYCDRMKYGNCYSSTNFILLGILLAQNAKATSWDNFDQMNAFPEAVQDLLPNTKFAVHGAPSKYTELNGYDLTDYNKQKEPKDVFNISGVYSGWTASDITAPVGDIAALVYEVYGPNERIVSKATQDAMYEASNGTGYGMATFNLTGHTGLEIPDPNRIAMGHLGATYGYQSIVAYFPGPEFSLAIGSNIERDYQEQPSDAMCGLYRTILAHQQGRTKPKCEYIKSYYHGGCKCTYPDH